MAAAELEVSVVSYNGQELDAPMVRALGQDALTVGRGTGNHLVLHDPERLISRQQARIRQIGDRLAEICNVSASSSLFVNGEELAPGASRQLAPSERVLVGRYLLLVCAASTRIARDPTEASPTAGVASQARLPDDFDVFAPEVSLPDAACGTLPLGDAAYDGDLDVFAELPGSDEGVLGAVHDDTPQSTNMVGIHADTLDPLAAFANSALQPAAIQVASDRGGEFDALFITPTTASRPVRTNRDHQSVEADAESDLSEAKSAARVMDGILGTETPDMDFEAEPFTTPMVDPSLRVLPDASAAAAASIMAVDHPEAMKRHVGDAPPPASIRVQTSSAIPDPDDSNAGVDTAPADRAALKLAFARGCGVPAEAINEFTEESLEQIGQLLAGLMAGTVRLIHGRSSTKHEMRANVTIISSEGNNPLKFAPDGHSALMQVLGRGLPGFMSPLQAVNSAFDDLSAHQVGLLAGSRTAMYEMAAQLGPEKLVKRLGSPTGLDAVLKLRHKARLWDLYAAGHARMAGDAREEFEAIFERAFARAYEQEIERLAMGEQP